jgi:hypothetical protein
MLRGVRMFSPQLSMFEYKREGSDTMFRWILLLLVLGIGVLIIRQLPALQRDIQRYIGMRSM